MLEFRYIKKPYWQVFTLCFLLAAMLFLPISLQDAIQGHVFHYAGDYNTQSMLFWQYCNEFVKSGGSYSWVTDLGSGFLTSYAFGIIGSPFFLVIFNCSIRIHAVGYDSAFCFKVCCGR